MDYENQKREIKKRKYKRIITNIINTINTLEEQVISLNEEIEFFVSIFNELEKYEKVKSYDDEDAQKEYWAAKLEEELNLRMLLQTPLDLELIKTILSLPDGTKVKVNLINNLAQVQKNIQKIAQKSKKEANESTMRILEE